MTAVKLRSWTVAEYHQMINTGILASHDRVELLNGEIIHMSPQLPPHSSTTQNSDEFLKVLLGDRASIRVQLPITLSHSEPEPDLAIVRRRTDMYSAAHPSAADVFLIVEVSFTTLDFDRTTKAQIYGQAGIEDYWVLDVASRQLYVLRNPTSQGYGSELVLQEVDRISPLAFPNLTINVAQLFPPL